MTLRKYLAESQRRHAFVAEGDALDIIVNEELCLEFDAIAHDHDSCLIEADDYAMNILESCGCTFDEDLSEGVMSEIDIDLHQIARNEDYDALYDLLTASSATGQFVQNMYDELAREYRLHPDDDQDAIIERLMDRISDDYGDPDFDPAEQMDEAEYQGRKVQLGKPMKGDVRKFKVYVRDPKTGNIKKVNFGDPNMEIRRDDPKRRKSFRARHGCGTPRASDRTKAAYWSCRMWSKKPVSKIV